MGLLILGRASSTERDYILGLYEAPMRTRLYLGPFIYHHEANEIQILVEKLSKIVGYHWC